MPQPIDLPTELSRVAAAERIQQIAMDRMSLTAQMRLQHEARQDAVNTENQVRETHAQSGNVETEARRRNPFVGKRRRNRKRPSDAEAYAVYDAHEHREIPDSVAEGHHLDVTVSDEGVTSEL